MPEVSEKFVKFACLIKERNEMKSFADYKQDAPNWITMANGEFYPDILADACELYKPVLVLFGQLLRGSESSIRLLQEITDVKEVWMRVQLYRVFRKYVSPQTPVEMLKKKSMIPMVCEQYGKNFRTIDRVQAAFNSRPLPDEALCAILWEYKDRGQKGYDLTERFFSMFQSALPNFTIEGPVRAGADIQLQSVFQDYPNPTRPLLRIRTINGMAKRVLSLLSDLLDTMETEVAHKKMTGLEDTRIVPKRFFNIQRAIISPPRLSLLMTDQDCCLVQCGMTILL